MDSIGSLTHRPERKKLHGRYGPLTIRLHTLSTHRAFFLLVAFAAALFLSDIWTYKEFVRAESYFALGARLMIERNEWLAPHAAEEMLLNKPPLTYWLIGISYKVLGPGYGAARLPSVLAALGVLAIVYALGVWMGGNRTGLISAAMLASSYLFVSFARMAMSDMLLTFCVTAAFACFIVALSENTNRSRRLAVAGYFALALGMLTKGPVAIALVAVPLILELALARDRALIKRLRLVPGLVVLVIPTVPYFLLVYTHFGLQPLRFFFLAENLQRFTGGVYGSSGRPFWYEFAAFVGDFAPWSVLAFLLPWFAWRSLRIEAGSAKGKGRRVLYLWLVCTILLFSLSSFKLDYYLLPAMPAAALTIGPIFANAHKLTRAMRRSVEAFLVLSASVVFLVALLSLKAASTLAIQTAFRFLPVILALAGLGVIVYCVLRRATWAAAMILTVTIWVTTLSMQLILTPAFARYLPATQLAAAVPTGRVVYTSWSANDWASNLAFNLPPPHAIERLTTDTDNQKLLVVLQNNAQAVAVVREREYAGLVEKEPSLKILALAETYGHAGLSASMLRAPKRERLLLIGHER